MKYVINHKTKPVACIELDDDTRKVIAICDIFIEKEMPVKLEGKNTIIDCGKIDRWIESRAIPASREKILEKLNRLKVKTTKDLSLISYGLNLTDHYWVCKETDNKQWERINFFDNVFNEDIGRVLFENTKIADAEILSPDCTLNGNLEKMWRIMNAKRVLIKGGNDNDRLEPFNEKLASVIMERLDVDHVRYDLFNQNNKTYCACECMVDRDHEFINAHFVYNHKGDDTNDGKYNDYIRALKNNGIKNAAETVDKMICLDFLIANSDRHHGNFGIIRNANTLEWEKPAPVFDSGTSMWAGKHQSIIRYDKTDNRSFGNTNEEIIGNIRNAGWFDKAKFSDIGGLYNELLAQNNFISKEKRIALCDFLEKRVEQFDTIVCKIKPKAGITPSQKKGGFKR